MQLLLKSVAYSIVADKVVCELHHRIHPCRNLVEWKRNRRKNRLSGRGNKTGKSQTQRKG